MTREYKFINLFRAIAAYWVLCYHCVAWSGWDIAFPSGKIAVDLFMMISGFLMVANAEAREAREPLDHWRNWCRFWMRRYFRIAPVYYLALALAVLSSTYFLGGYAELQRLNPDAWPPGGTYDPSNFHYDTTTILMHLSFLFGLHPIYSSSTYLPDWSLGLEMQFYLFFPALWLLMRRFGFLRTGVLLGGATFVAGYLLAKKVHYMEPSLLLFKLNYFVAGMLLFKALASVTAQRQRWLQILGATLLVSMDIRYHWQLPFEALLLLSMAMIGRLETRGAMPRLMEKLLDSRGLHLASEASYSVYLLHGFFISAFGLILSNYSAGASPSAAPRFALMLFFVTLGSYAAAFLVFRKVEQPGVRIGKRFLRRVAAPPTRIA